MSEITIDGEIKSFSFGCAFCDQKLEEKETYQMCLIWPDSQYQVWWVHRACYEERLHPRYRTFRDKDGS